MSFKRSYVWRRRLIYLLMVWALFNPYAWRTWERILQPRPSLIAPVQHNKHRATGASTNTFVFSGSPVAGNCLIFAVAWTSKTITINSTPSGASQAGTTIQSVAGAGVSMSLAVYYVKNCSTGTSYAFGFSSNVTSHVLGVEASGLDTVAPSDKNNNAASNSASSATSGSSGTLSQAAEFSFVCLVNDVAAGFGTASNSYSQLDLQTGIDAIESGSYYLVTAATTSTSTSATITSGPGDYVGIIATFQPAGDGGVSAFFPQVMGTFEPPIGAFMMMRRDQNIVARQSYADGGPAYYLNDPNATLANPVEWQSLPVEHARPQTDLKARQYAVVRAQHFVDGGPGYFTDDPNATLANPVEWLSLPVPYPYRSFMLLADQRSAARSPTFSHPEGDAPAIAGESLVSAWQPRPEWLPHPALRRSAARVHTSTWDTMQIFQIAEPLLGALYEPDPFPIRRHQRRYEAFAQPFSTPSIWVVLGELQSPPTTPVRQVYPRRDLNPQPTMDTIVWATPGTIQFMVPNAERPTRHPDVSRRDTAQMAGIIQMGTVIETIHVESAWSVPQRQAWLRPVRYAVDWTPPIPVDATVDTSMAWHVTTTQQPRPIRPRELPQAFDPMASIAERVPAYPVFDAAPYLSPRPARRLDLSQERVFLVGDSIEAAQGWNVPAIGPLPRPVRRLIAAETVQDEPDRQEKAIAWNVAAEVPTRRAATKPHGHIAAAPFLETLANVDQWAPIYVQPQQPRPALRGQPGPAIEAEVFPTTHSTEASAAGWIVPQAPTRPATIRPPFPAVAAPLTQDTNAAVLQTWQVEPELPRSFRRRLSAREMTEATSDPPIHESGVVIIVAGPYRVTAGQIFFAGAVAGDIAAE